MRVIDRIPKYVELRQLSVFALITYVVFLIHLSVAPYWELCLFLSVEGGFCFGSLAIEEGLETPSVLSEKNP